MSLKVNCLYHKDRIYKPPQIKTRKTCNPNIKKTKEMLYNECSKDTYLKCIVIRNLF